MRERGVVIASGHDGRRRVGRRVRRARSAADPGAFSEDWIKTPFYDLDTISQVVSIAGFLGLVAYIWLGAEPVE